MTVNKLKSVTIYGLFGKYRLTLPLGLRPLVLVGPNGTGKSTVLSILNLFLTGQWAELAKFPLESIAVSYDDSEICLTLDDIASLALITQAFRLNNLSSLRLSRSSMPDKWEEAQRYMRVVRPGATTEVSALGERYPYLRNAQAFVDSISRPMILYYPTYRRIEREIGDILDFSEFKNLEANLGVGIKRRFEQFGEVIGFGGQDIYGLISNATSDIENRARQALNEHSIKFLEFISQPGTLSTKVYRDSILDENKTNSLLERISILAPHSIDSQKLRQSITSIQEKLNKGGAGRLSAREDVAIFYIARLLQVFRDIEKFTTPLQQFCSLVNGYLQPYKSVLFDESHFKVQIFDREGEARSLESFSSGEKQIISLFAFLMFSDDRRGKILIIDEPELSLSSIWQKQLLSDLLGTGRPDLLVTATHSPYIFEDFDLSNALSMDELLVAE